MKNILRKKHDFAHEDAGPPVQGSSSDLTAPSLSDHRIALFSVMCVCAAYAQEYGF